MSADVPTLSVGVLGAGTVGSQVIRLLTERADDLSARCGARLHVSGVLVRNLDAPRDVDIDQDVLTTNPADAIDGKDLVIELIGGIEPARTLVLRALNQGISVITGNKALLATHGPELYAAAAAANTDLYYEAAVAGAIPVVYGLRESLVGDRITQVLGIVNGTTNFILDAMTQGGTSYEDALAQAQALGFAEADPSADVDGWDSAAKCAILASLAFHTQVSINDVAVEGITGITAADIDVAHRLGRVIKLLAVAKRRESAEGEGVDVCVYPVLLPLDHTLAGVGGAFNAVVVDGEAAGRLMFYGQGAGGAPTASAVLSDVVAAASHRVHGGHAPRESSYANLPIMDPGMSTSSYLIRLDVVDLPGVLAEVAGVLSDEGLSIQSVHQYPSEEAGHAQLVLATHQAAWHHVVAVRQQLSELAHVNGVAQIIRMEG